MPPLAPPPPEPAAAVAPAAEAAPAAGLLAVEPSVHLGGYGELWAVHDSTGTNVRLRRFVLSADAMLNDRVGADGDLEIENGTDLEIEEAFVHARVAPPLELSAGLVLVPLGIVNLHDEAPTFDGVDRPVLDHTLLPTTWREFGALATYASPAGWSVTGGALTGPSAAGIRPWTLAGMRGQGLPVPAADMVGVGRVELTRWSGVDVGAGALYGGASGGDPTLGGVRLGLAEIDADVTIGGFEGRAEAVGYTLSDAARVTEAVRAQDASSDAVGSTGLGAYGELSYDVLRPFVASAQQARLFARYEYVDPRATVPDDVVDAGDSWAAHYLTFGARWLPLPALAVKADATVLLAGRLLPGTSENVSLGLSYMY